MQQTKTILQTLIDTRHTLESIEVHGRENLNRLLGCILTLDKVIDAAGKEDEDVQDNAE